MKIKVLTNPVTDLFLDLVRRSKEQLLASPFVKSEVAGMILENIPCEASLSVLTNYRLASFHRKSSDLGALRGFIENGAEVRSHPMLHAKTYIFDSREAIVTSGNLTLGGLRNNYECGVLIDDPGIVGKLRSHFKELFSDVERVSVVNAEIIATTEEILGKVPEEKKVRFAQSEKDLLGAGSSEPEDDLYDGGIESIGETLSGWRLDVFREVSQIKGNVFRLEQAYAAKDRLAALHPENRNIEAKIRQQLQELRDLGLIEFRGAGVYRKLWKDG